MQYELSNISTLIAVVMVGAHRGFLAELRTYGMTRTTYLPVRNLTETTGIPISSPKGLVDIICVDYVVL